VHKREKDLVAATQGRSFWVLDDLPVLHQVSDAIAKAEAHLLKPEDAYRMPGGGGFRMPAATIGENPPSGAVVYYYLKNKPVGEVTLEFVDSTGKSIKKLSSKASQQPGGPEAALAAEGFFLGPGVSERVGAEAGLNRFVWNLRHPDAKGFPGLIMWAGSLTGPRAIPGVYQVKLTVDGKTLTESFELKKDPRVETSQADFANQLELLLKIRDKLTETHEAIIRIRDVRKQVDDVIGRVKDQADAKPVVDAGRSLNEKMKAVEEELYQTKNQSSQDPLNYPIKLNNKLAALGGVVGSADARPTDQSYVVYEELVAKINEQLQKLDQILRTDLPAFNRRVREQDIPAVMAPIRPGGSNQ
jgi:hypothetical protein